MVIFGNITYLNKRTTWIVRVHVMINYDYFIVFIKLFENTFYFYFVN